MDLLSTMVYALLVLGSCIFGISVGLLIADKEHESRQFVSYYKNLKAADCEYVRRGREV